MTLQIGAVLTRAGELTASRAGGQLMVLYAVYGVVYQLGVNGVLAAAIRWLGASPDAGPPVLLDAPIAVHVALAVAGLGLGLFVTLVALRTLAARERGRIPRWALTHRPLRGMVNLLVVGILFTLILAVGFILLVLPGVIAYIAFVFSAVFVADEDATAISALRQSYRLSRGHWLRIGVTLLIVFGVAMIIAMGISLVTAFGVGAIGLDPALIGLGTLVLFAPASIYVFAVLTELYNQLRTAETSSSDDLEQL